MTLGGWSSLLMCSNHSFQGPQVYQTKFGPSYKVSYCTSIGLLAVTVLTICLTWFLVHKSDKQRAVSDVAATDEENGGLEHPKL